jgi:hypothetical protein
MNFQWKEILNEEEEKGVGERKEERKASRILLWIRIMIFNFYKLYLISSFFLKYLVRSLSIYLSLSRERERGYD